MDSETIPTAKLSVAHLKLVTTSLASAEGNNSILVSIEVSIDLQSTIEYFLYFFILGLGHKDATGYCIFHSSTPKQ